YAGYNDLYDGRRRPAPVIEAACWAHGRRKLFDIAKLTKAPIAVEAVRRIDEIFAVERTINGRISAERVAARQQQSKPLVLDLEHYLREQRMLLSAKSDTAKAINYILIRWVAFTRFLDDGRICLSNNAAERALRGIAIGRRNWTFCGSDAGGHRAAAIYTLIETAKLNDVDPQAWLADVLARLPDHPSKRLDELLPWNWKISRPASALAQAA
ncbi:MAG: IS66 family transposase, partial [Janthinobacterium lividum]